MSQRTCYKKYFYRYYMIHMKQEEILLTLKQVNEWRGIHLKYPLLVQNVQKLTEFLSDNVSFSQRAWHILNNYYKVPRCKICQNHVKWNKSKQSYRTYCSNDCSHKDNELNEKRRSSFLHLYGVDNPSKDKKVKEKRKQTNVKRCGVENVFQNKEIQQKQKQTCLEKYGVDNPSKDKKVKEKRKQTLLKRYGATHNWASVKLRNNANKKHLDKYGVQYPQQRPDFKEQIKQTNLERYGVENVFQNKEIQQKQHRTNLERYGTQHPQQRHNITAFAQLGNYEWLYQQYLVLEKSAAQISHELNVDPTTISNYLRKYDILTRRIGMFSYKCIQWLEYISNTENVFIQHAGNMGEYQISNTRYFADGFCKETNTIYEFHGDAWHGNPETYLPDEHCHPFDSDITAGELYQKTIKREKRIKLLGFNLVVIWENDWNMSK